MHRLFQTIVLTSLFAYSTPPSEAQAQVYAYPSTSYYVPQNRAIIGSPRRIYSNIGIRYQSYRRTYNQPRVYSNGSYYSQPYQTYPRNGGSYYYAPSNPYYSNYSDGPHGYYGTQGNWNQPFQSGYGTGYYVNPQQAANANTGAVIGGAIGGNRGARLGAVIGGSIRP